MFPLLTTSQLIVVSCDVECGFSRSGLMVSKRRHALARETVRAETTISAWAKVPNLLPEQCDGF